MDQTPQSRRTWWRFSLRELLLLITTVAAVMALFATHYRRSQPFRPTKMSDRFCGPGQVRETLQRIGVSRPALFQGGGGPFTESEFRSASAHYVIEINEQELLALVSELIADAERQINDEGGRSNGGGEKGGQGHKHASMHYWVGQTFGEVHVAGDSLPNNKARLFIFVHEHCYRH